MNDSSFDIFGPVRELRPGTLARFAHGLSWPHILDLTAGRGKRWWLEAIMDAEDRGLLTWDRDRLVWVLTDAGRELVRSVA